MKEVYKAIDQLKHDIEKTLGDIARLEKLAIALLKQIDDLVLKIEKEE